MKLSVARRRRPVVLHLDRAVAHDLLQALTQALEPPFNQHGEIKEKPEGSAPESKKRDGKEHKGKKRKRKKS
jgi:hypothetical protein